MREITISEDLWNELWEYFDNRQDADWDYENRKAVPNKEMKLLHELEKAFEQSKKVYEPKY